MTTNPEFALLKALEAVGKFMIPEDTLFADVNIRLARPITHTQFRQALAHAEEKRRILSVDGEDGRKWKITDDGLGRLAELV